MSANVDKSLGDIISSRKSSTRGRAAKGRRGGARAPAGGVGKNTSTKATVPKGPAKAAALAAAAKLAAPAKGNKKILVSGLPPDVQELHLKEYFGSKVGPINKVELSYDARGKFRGIATVIFRQDGLAQKAVADHNGVAVDGKPLRVEIVYDAAHLPPVAAPKSLSDRITNKPKQEKATTRKDKPKKVEAKKERNASTAGEAGRGKRGRNAGRPKKKTADELDAEMTDYFGGGGGQSAPAAAAPAAAAPAVDAMEEEEVL